MVGGTTELCQSTASDGIWWRFEQLGQERVNVKGSLARSGETRKGGVLKLGVDDDLFRFESLSRDKAALETPY